MRSGHRRNNATGWIALAAGAAVAGGLLHALPAPAVEFGEGAFTGSLDTTISHGMTFRVEDRDDELAGDTNGNDGNLNYDRGIVSNAPSSPPTSISASAISARSSAPRGSSTSRTRTASARAPR